MLQRRAWIKAALLGAGSLTWLPLRPAAAQQGSGTNGADRLNLTGIANLEDTLLKGLRVVRPQQKTFVSTVVSMVKNGQLPRAMVLLVFTWARKRNPRVPFPYFEFALRELAKRRNITIP